MSKKLYIPNPEVPLNCISGQDIHELLRCKAAPQFSSFIIMKIAVLIVISVFFAVVGIIVTAVTGLIIT